MTFNTTQPKMVSSDKEPTTKIRVSDKDEVDLWVMGEGDPVVFVHGAVVRDLLTPLIDALANKGSYQLIHYGRRGYGGHGLPNEPVDIVGEAADIVKILDALGIDTAHVAGHSFGANIALELATRAPHRLLSVILLEHIFTAQMCTDLGKQAVNEAKAAFMGLSEMYSRGDKELAITTLLGAISGRVEGARELFDRALPEGALELAAHDLNLLQAEVTNFWPWTADPLAVQENTTPIAWVSYPDAVPQAQESGAILQEWQPATEVIEIASASSHAFPTLNAAETATALHEWLQSEDSSN